MARRYDILYLSGDVNIHKSYAFANLQSGERQIFGSPFLSQFFSVCADRNLKCHVVSIADGEDETIDGHRFTYIKPPFSGRGWAFYHIGQLMFMLRILMLCIRDRPKLLLLTYGRYYWFVFALVPWFGTKIGMALHAVLWPKLDLIRYWLLILLRLSRSMFKTRARFIMCTSDDIAHQIVALTKGSKAQIRGFLPTWPPEDFADLESDPVGERAPDGFFRVMYASRLEANKGIFDLLSAARHIKDLGHDRIRFDICGAGHAEDRVRGKVGDLGLGDVVTVHGHCEKNRMRELYRRCDTVVVPTRTDFTEGYNMVVAEGILWRKPVITSEVCLPIGSGLDEAVLRVRPNVWEAYADAIIRLFRDDGLYQAKASATVALRGQFLDETRSWGHVFSRCLDDIGL